MPTLKKLDPHPYLEENEVLFLINSRSELES